MGMYQTDGVRRLTDMNEDISRILVVDSDPSRCALVAEILAPGPFEIVAAFSGSEAMETIAEEPPHVIVTSHLVAGMSALDLVRWLRARPATEKTPVIVMSGLDQREDLASVLEDEGTDFIATPLQAVELLRAGTHRTVTALWTAVTEGDESTHNAQMDVVLALWKNGLIV